MAFVILFGVTVPVMGHTPAVQTRETNPVIIPDTGGPIAQIVLHYVSEFATALSPAYHDLFEALPRDITIQVLCPFPTDAQAFLADWGLEATSGGRRLQLCSVGCPISIWARDRRIPRQDHSSARPANTIVPACPAIYEQDKRNEVLLAGLLQDRGLLAGFCRSDVCIEGGDIVSNQVRVFIGANVIQQNAGWFATGNLLDQELLALFGRPYVILADDYGSVPWCHADMYVTPVDQEVMLVGSLPQVLNSPVYGGNDSATDEGATHICLSLEMQAERAASLDAIADQLTGLGYQVTRTPVVLAPDNEWMITYNNVIMEQRGKKRVVYMPVYQIPHLDEQATSIYECLGFEVQPIDVSGIYQYGGAVRCLVNVIERRSLAGGIEASAPAGLSGTNHGLTESLSALSGRRPLHR